MTDIYGWCTECKKPINMCGCEERRVETLIAEDAEIQEMAENIGEYFDRKSKCTSSAREKEE